jgi:hypothetical protein
MKKRPDYEGQYPNRIKVISDERMVTNARIIHVARDGTETDISDCVQTVDIRLEIGEVSRAKLGVILVTVEAEAAIVSFEKQDDNGWSPE